MFVFISKKKVNDLKLELLDAKQNAYNWRIAAEAAKKDLNMWRAKYELSQLTPEVKADTEAAFTRGAQFAKTQALNNLMFLMQGISTEEPKEETNA